MVEPKTERTSPSDSPAGPTAILLERTYPRTLDAMVATLPARLRPGETVELWCFEDEPARRAAEARLAARGIPARIRSALKPLVHAFLEELPRHRLAAVRVALPVHPDAADGRFALEAHPLAAMLGTAPLTFETGAPGLDHLVSLIGEDGGERRATVAAPNVSRTDHTGARILAPTGWLRTGRPGGPPRLDERVECEIETLFCDAMAAIATHPWPAAEPQFERLVIEAAIPAIHRPLGIGEEVVDTVEALHEDLYFSILELFVRRSGRRDGARDLRPGQIVPLIRATDGPATLSVRLERFGPDDFAMTDDGRPLAATGTPPTPTRIAAALAELGGAPFAARSRQGRPVLGAFFDGSGPGVAISAGRHADETTGIVGALRAAAALKAGGRRFAVTPCENPDGYALHHRLRRDNPSHIHHAARYTALGDDLGHRSGADGEVFELAARREALARSAAGLHVDLHGYPSHEWIRPFTGYVPRGFPLWALPKGFFLLVEHRPGLTDPARRLTERLAARLAAELPEMIALNAAQIARYRAHLGTFPFELVAGIACRIEETERAVAPIGIVTEYPDETIGGEAFRLGHECQVRAAVAAAEIFAEMSLGARPPRSMRRSLRRS